MVLRVGWHVLTNGKGVVGAGRARVGAVLGAA